MDTGLGLIKARHRCGATEKKFVLNCSFAKARELLAEHFEGDAVLGIPVTMSSGSSGVEVTLKTSGLAADRFTKATKAFDEVFS